MRHMNPPPVSHQTQRLADGFHDIAHHLAGLSDLMAAELAGLDALHERIERLERRVNALVEVHGT